MRVVFMGANECVCFHSLQHRVNKDSKTRDNEIDLVEFQFIMITLWWVASCGPGGGTISILDLLYIRTRISSLVSPSV